MPGLMTLQTFISKANEKHNNKYEYTKVIYINSQTPVTITCPKHGSWLQRPNDHLMGKGCKKCANEAHGKLRRKTTQVFIQDAIKAQGDTYSYSLVDYSTCMEPVTITCKIHGNFTQIPNNHLRGAGCPICAELKSAREHHPEPTILYYIRIDSPIPLYKVGITIERVGIEKRFKQEDISYTILKEEVFPLGVLAFSKEQEILQKFKEYKYSGVSVLRGGDSELFTEDVLSLELNKGNR